MSHTSFILENIIIKLGIYMLTLFFSLESLLYVAKHYKSLTQPVIKKSE